MLLKTLDKILSTVKVWTDCWIFCQHSTMILQQALWQNVDRLHKIFLRFVNSLLSTFATLTICLNFVKFCLKPIHVATSCQQTCPQLWRGSRGLSTIPSIHITPKKFLPKIMPIWKRPLHLDKSWPICYNPLQFLTEFLKCLNGMITGVTLNM